MILVVATTMACVFASCIHPFLAPTSRVASPILVVEGWVNQFTIQAAIAEFQQGEYRLALTTGGPVGGLGHYVNDYQTSASVAASRLRSGGLAAASVQMVPSRVMSRDRTYGSAVALREWLQYHSPGVCRLNVLTEGAHARRTRLLFEKALGDQVSVGIISVPSPDYDAKRWWRYSEGVREVLGETIAYIYARFFFYPAALSP